MSEEVPSRGRVTLVAFVGLAGFFGAVSRHALALALPGSFPWGTLTANVLGSVTLAGGLLAAILGAALAAAAF